MSQQLSTKAAATIAGRVAALGAGGFPTPTDLARIPYATLREAGLSDAKARSVADLAERVLDGRLPLEGLGALEDEAVIETLVAVRGIGRWTAEMFLMFRLRRPDVLSTGDLGLQKGMTDAAKTSCSYAYESIENPTGDTHNVSAQLVYGVTWDCDGACLTPSGDLGEIDAPAGDGTTIEVRQRQTVVTQ